MNSQQSSPPEDLPSVTTISESDLAEFAAPFLPFLSEPFPAAPAESRAAPRPGLLLASSFAVDPVNLEKFVLQYARYLVRLQNWTVNVFLLVFVCWPTFEENLFKIEETAAFKSQTRTSTDHTNLYILLFYLATGGAYC